MPISLGGNRKFLLAQSLEDLTAFAGAVVAIGNFDGVHLGHRQLLEATLAEARRLGVPALAITFEPHPRTLLRPENPVFRLTPAPAKQALLEALGFAGMIVIPFDRTFAERSAQSFVEDILVARLSVRGVVVGYDFHFGKDRKGTPQFLADSSRAYGFEVLLLPPVKDVTGEAYSSFRIRAALAAGEISAANAMLGYRWFVQGEVVHGQKRGRLLGFPTANIALPSDSRLRHGIYAVEMRRPDFSRHQGVASFGRRPTFDNGDPLLEVFLFDFDAPLYGEFVAVSFLAWIRPELAFPSPAALSQQMVEDVEAAVALLSLAGPGTSLDQALARPV